MTEESREQCAARQIEIIERFLGCIGSLDLDRAGDYLDEHCEMTLPYLPSSAPLHGRAAIIAQFKATMPQMLERMDFTFLQWYPSLDSDVVIAEYRSYCPLKGGGGVYENDYITVFRFREDRIVLYREYLNPLQLNFG